ncbi:MAG: hypothetical protein QOF00_2345, partial [Pseudonocardiales bacterium]|nr:hypothetical protein [Pseudonocardiales bacterium]
MAVGRGDTRLVPMIDGVPTGRSRWQQVLRRGAGEVAAVGLPAVAVLWAEPPFSWSVV